MRFRSLSALILSLISPAFADFSDVISSLEQMNSIGGLKVLQAPKLSCGPTDPPKDPALKKNPCRKDGFRKQNIPLFQSNDVLEVTMRADFKALKASPYDRYAKQSEAPMFNGTLEYGTGGAKDIIPIGLQKRGGSRGDYPWPQLKLILSKTGKFSNGDFEGTAFENADGEMKLVLPMVKEDTESVMAEYALYRILQASGLPAFDTRLLKVNFIDATGSVEPIYVIALESSSDLARRLGGVVVPGGGHVSTFFDEMKDVYHQGLLLNGSLFDHDNHNFETIRKGELAFPVPYDFDLSRVLTETNTYSIFQWDFLSEPFSDSVLLSRIYSNKVEIYKEFLDVPFSSESIYRPRIQKWLDSYFIELEKYLAAQGILKDGVLSINTDVVPGEKPKLFFQLSCKEQAALKAKKKAEKEAAKAIASPAPEEKP